MEIVCPKCLYKLQEGDLWIDDRTCYKHVIVISRKFKYDCSKCSFYQPWFVDKTVGDCVKCYDETKERNELIERFNRGESFDFAVNEEDCMESYPCKHNVKIKLLKDNKQFTILMDADKIVHLHNKLNKSIPSHYLPNVDFL